MTARSIVEAGMEREAEVFLGQRRGESEGPAVLLAIEGLLDAQNRYEEAAAVATRLGAAYPAAAERLDAEEIAAAALRKAKKDDESMARRGTLEQPVRRGDRLAVRGRANPRGDRPGRRDGDGGSGRRGIPLPRGGPRDPPGGPPSGPRAVRRASGEVPLLPESGGSRIPARMAPLRGRPESGSAARLRIGGATPGGIAGRSRLVHGRAVRQGSLLAAESGTAGGGHPPGAGVRAGLPRRRAPVPRSARSREGALPPERVGRGGGIGDPGGTRRPHPRRSADRVPHRGGGVLRGGPLRRGGDGVPGSPRRGTCAGRAAGDREMGGLLDVPRRRAASRFPGLRCGFPLPADRERISAPPDRPRGPVPGRRRLRRRRKGRRGDRGVPRGGERTRRFTPCPRRHASPGGAVREVGESAGGGGAARAALHAGGE